MVDFLLSWSLMPGDQVELIGLLKLDLRDRPGQICQTALRYTRLTSCMYIFYRTKYFQYPLVIQYLKLRG